MWDVEICHSNSYVHTHTHTHRSVRHVTCDGELRRHTSYSVRKLWQDGCCITATHRNVLVILQYSWDYVNVRHKQAHEGRLKYGRCSALTKVGVVHGQK